MLLALLGCALSMVAQSSKPAAKKPVTRRPATSQKPATNQRPAARRPRPRATAAAHGAPAVVRAQMALAQKMARNAGEMAAPLPLSQRVALLTRLLYTMRSDVMAAEKKQWAEELFTAAQQFPHSTPTEMEARNTALATAAARLALYDPEHALALLDALPPTEGQRGDQPDARSMAARLLFAGYMQHHPGGAGVLMEHARRWSTDGSFPYGASAAILARLRGDEDASEQFFRQVLTIFSKGDEGLYGTAEFAGLLQQAVSMEAILADTAEEAGRAIGAQLSRHVADDQQVLAPPQEAMMLGALNNLRVSAPKAYAQLLLTAPALAGLRAPRAAAPQEPPPLDAEMETAFHELGETIRLHRGPEATRASVVSSIRLVNARYSNGACAECNAPDAQSAALVSLAAYAMPAAIAAQLNAIEDPFWRAYFLAIAAQQVGQPTRVADPAARKLPGKEEPEPE